MEHNNNILCVESRTDNNQHILFLMASICFVIKLDGTITVPNLPTYII